MVRAAKVMPHQIPLDNPHVPCDTSPMKTSLRFLAGRQVLSVCLDHSGDTALPVLELLLRGAFPGHAVLIEKRSGMHQPTKSAWSQVRYEILLPCTAGTLHATVVAASRALRDICLTPEMVYS